MAYYAIEPWGEERADLRMGISTAAIVNRHLGRSERPKQPADFMPKFGEPPKPQTVETMKAIWGAIKRAASSRARRAEPSQKQASAHLPPSSP